MSPSSPHRKRIKHHHDPGHCRELTFSCYKRMPLLSDDQSRALLSEAIDRACTKQGWALAAFVYMPEHVHLLTYPVHSDSRIGAFLRAVKRPFSYRMKKLLEEHKNPLLGRLTVVQRPGIATFRFWQQGPGYDRNLTREKSVLAAIDYIHLNPVRRLLCKDVKDWKWSSARWYATHGTFDDNSLPKLTAVPSDFFVGPSDYTPD